MGFWGEFGEGGREGGFGYGFLCIIDYWLGFLSWFFFLSFSPFLSFRERRYVSSYFFSCFLPFFFSFPCPFLPFLSSDENHQRLESGAIPSNHWAGSAKAMIPQSAYSCYVRSAFPLLFICRELAFYDLSSESVEKSFDYA